MNDTELVVRVARAVRRNRFERTRRRNFDETVPPTENELDDARAAIAVVHEIERERREYITKIFEDQRQTRPAPEEPNKWVGRDGDTFGPGDGT